MCLNLDLSLLLSTAKYNSIHFALFGRHPPTLLLLYTYSLFNFKVISAARVFFLPFPLTWIDFNAFDRDCGQRRARLGVVTWCFHGWWGNCCQRQNPHPPIHFMEHGFNSVAEEKSWWPSRMLPAELEQGHFLHFEVFLHPRSNICSWNCEGQKVLGRIFNCLWNLMIPPPPPPLPQHQYRTTAPTRWWQL